MKLKRLVKELENPYPERIFTPITDRQYAKIHKILLKELNIPLDRISADLMRQGFEVCKNTILNMLEEEEGEK